MSTKKRIGPRALKSYETKFDRGRVRHGLGPTEWATETGIPRTQLLRYRAGEEEPQVETLAKLVRSAAVITGRSIKASDFVELGEDEPVHAVRVQDCPWRKYKQPKTRLEALLIREHVRPEHLAAAAPLSRTFLHRLRKKKATMMVTTLARIVRALRRMGRDVKASDVVDVGEDQDA